MMTDLNEVIDLFFDNIKHLFFPESWLQIDLKFSKSEIFAMLLIEKKHEITMTELSEYINAPMSTANGLVERLFKKGYVIRDRSDLDRRIVVLRLTEEGAQLLANIKGIVSSYLKMALEDLSQEEIQFLADIAIKIIHSLQKKISTEPASSAETKIRKIDIQ